MTTLQSIRGQTFGVASVATAADKPKITRHVATVAPHLWPDLPHHLHGILIQYNSFLKNPSQHLTVQYTHPNNTNPSGSILVGPRKQPVITFTSSKGSITFEVDPTAGNDNSYILPALIKHLEPLDNPPPAKPRKPGYLTLAGQRY